MRHRFSGPGWAAFRSRDFRLFAAARLLYGAATQMQNVAVGWLIYDLTKSAWALGLAGLAAFLPSLFLVLVTGPIADRFERRIVLLISYVLLAASALGLVSSTALGLSQVWPLYALIVIAGAAKAFGHPAGQAMIPSLVPRADFANAIAWNSSTWHAAIITGPALGGFLYALGPRVVFATAAACFAVAAFLTALIAVRPPRLAREPVSWAAVSAGLTYIRSRPVLFGAVSLDLFAVLLGGATALLPIYAQDILEVGPWGLGLLRSMPGLGSVCTAVVLAHLSLRRKAGRRMLQAVAVYGLAIVGFGLSQSLWLSLMFLFISGAGDMVSVYVRQTLVQLETPDHMRGRVSAVNSVFVGASNELGEFESGVLAALVGAVSAVVIGGLGTIGVAALWARLFPALRDRDALIP
jgi:MFS family permease